METFYVKNLLDRLVIVSISTGEIISVHSSKDDFLNRTILKFDIEDYLKRNERLMIENDIIYCNDIGYWFLDWEGVEEYQPVVEFIQPVTISNGDSTTIYFDNINNYTIPNSNHNFTVNVNAINPIDIESVRRIWSETGIQVVNNTPNPGILEQIREGGITNNYSRLSLDDLASFIDLNPQE